MKTIEQIITVLGVAAFAWMWSATLITYACNAWWTSREKYRKRMDRQVAEEFLSEHQQQVN